MTCYFEFKWLFVNVKLAIESFVCVVHIAFQ